MPEVVYARPAVIGWAAQPNLPRQSPEDPVDVLMQQSATALGDEEVRTVARSEVSIAPFGVAAESHAGRRMQGREARLAKLAAKQNDKMGRKRCWLVHDISLPLQPLLPPH